MLRTVSNSSCPKLERKNSIKLGLSIPDRYQILLHKQTPWWRLWKCYKQPWIDNGKPYKQNENNHHLSFVTGWFLVYFSYFEFLNWEQTLEDFLPGRDPIKSALRSLFDWAKIANEHRKYPTKILNDILLRINVLISIWLTGDDNSTPGS